MTKDSKRRISVGSIKIGFEEKNNINQVVESGRISEGKFVNEFEQKWADFIGVKNCILTNSGTTAIMAGIKAIEYKEDIKQNSKIITTPLTYVATSNAIINTNHTPVYIDIEPETFNINPEKIKEHLESLEDSSDYSLIFPVHLMGYPCDMNKINKIAKKHGLITFEDSAQAHGTKFNGKVCGSMSKLSDYSFYIAHNIQAGEMGAIVTDDDELARVIRKIKANGRMCDCPICTRNKGYCPKREKNDSPDPRFLHDMIGYNFKTTEFQAAIACAQFKKINEIIKKRQENIKQINEGISCLSEQLKLPNFSKDVSYIAYPLVIKNNIDREILMNKLEKKGIETRPLFGSIPTQQPAFSKYKIEYEGKLPNSDRIGKKGFYIGCHQYLKQEDIEYIIKTLKEVVKDDTTN